jgi:predicted DNA-binding protein
MAHEARSIPSSPDKVKLTLNVSLSRELAERLTAIAIREGKNLEALVAEILEAVSE